MSTAADSRDTSTSAAGPSQVTVPEVSQEWLDEAAKPALVEWLQQHAERSLLRKFSLADVASTQCKHVSRADLIKLVKQVIDTPQAALEFIPFIEQNMKENETFIFYLQWTGNEEQLMLLNKGIEHACYDDIYGDCSIVTMDINTKIPESAVDIHKRIQSLNGYHKMFTKCIGTFTCPYNEETIESLDEFQMATLLDQTFYSCKIETMFSGYRNPYVELLQGRITREEYERLKDE
jgi:hypothetical protein